MDMYSLREYFQDFRRNPVDMRKSAPCTHSYSMPLLLVCTGNSDSRQHALLCGIVHVCEA